MAIEFPCLKTDLSQWFADAEGTKRSEEQQLLESLKMFLISEEAQSSKVIEFPRMDQPSSYWLCREHVKGDIDDNNDDDCDDIMAPVLGPTDSTQWLVQKADSKVQDERIADINTSMWLSSTSLDAFTCVTLSPIKWPSILIGDSNDMWLMKDSSANKQQGDPEDLDQWLVKEEGRNSKSLKPLESSSGYCHHCSFDDTSSSIAVLDEDIDNIDFMYVDKVDPDDDSEFWLL